MTPDSTAILISAIGLVLSLLGSAFIAGFRFGSVANRLDRLEKSQEALATKDQLAGVKEDVAEIKGMLGSTFRFTLREDVRDQK